MAKIMIKDGQTWLTVNMLAAQAGSPVPIADELRESRQQDYYKAGKASGGAGENDDTGVAVLLPTCADGVFGVTA